MNRKLNFASAVALLLSCFGLVAQPADLKPAGPGAYLDAAGQLHLEKVVQPDPFDPPGTPERQVLQATGYFFEDVPTYGWPLSTIYKNNPLQFASQATAEKICGAVAQVLGPNFTTTITLDEVKVGPFRRAPIRQITISQVTNSEAAVSLNAGLLASKLARDQQSWAAGLRIEVAAGLGIAK